MKKLVILSLLSVALLSSCGNGAKNEAMKAQNDSLMVELSSRNAELDEIMGAFNEVQEGLLLFGLMWSRNQTVNNRLLYDEIIRH